MCFVEGLHDQAYCFWSRGVQRWLQLQSTALKDQICVSTVIDNAKALYRQAFHQADHSVGRYRQMLQVQHQYYVLAPYRLFKLILSVRSKQRQRTLATHTGNADVTQSKLLTCIIMMSLHSVKACDVGEGDKHKA